MAFQINKLALADSFELKLRNPSTDAVLLDDETGLPVTIILYGRSSTQYRNAVNALQNARLKAKKDTMSAEKLSEDSIELLVAISVKSDSLELDGMKFNGADNSAAFRKLYSSPEYSWVNDQVNEQVAEVSNFLEK